MALALDLTQRDRRFILAGRISPPVWTTATARAHVAPDGSFGATPWKQPRWRSARPGTSSEYSADYVTVGYQGCYLGRDSGQAAAHRDRRAHKMPGQQPRASAVITPSARGLTPSPTPSTGTHRRRVRQSGCLQDGWVHVGTREPALGVRQHSRMPALTGPWLWLLIPFGM